MGSLGLTCDQVKINFPVGCRHREEMIYTCTYSEMRILQLIVFGTLANAGRPERVKNKTKHIRWCLFLVHFCQF
jgi:hypothetical protein